MSTQGPEKIKEMVDTLRKWQGIERQAMDQTAEIMEQSDNPLIRMIMEIIRHDSLMHHRVQQFLIDSVTKAPVTLTPDEVGLIWTKIEEHDATERETLELAKQLKSKSWNAIQK